MTSALSYFLYGLLHVPKENMDEAYFGKTLGRTRGSCGLSASRERFDEEFRPKDMAWGKRRIFAIDFYVSL